MKQWVIIEKEVGQTPLQAVEAYKAWTPGMADVKMAYAGRLDPMASGKLLVLVGDECQKQKLYHALDKTYVVDVLLGARSDTGDVLGLMEATSEPKEYSRNKLVGVVRSLRGKLELPYPAFSSKTVQGKPLHTWALEGKLDEIEIPKQSGYIYNLSIKKILRKTGQGIYDEALKKVNSLPPVTAESKALGADFRRHDVRGTWSNFLSYHDKKEFTVVQITCTCSSGTYMRSLAEEIGSKLGTGGMALGIHRTHIGRKLWLPFGLSIWIKKYV